MSKFFNVCFWMLSVFLFLIGLVSFSSSDMISMGFFMIFLGLLALPPLRTCINSKLTQSFENQEKAPNPIAIKFLIGFIKFIVIFIVFMIVVSTNSNVSQNAVDTANSKQIQSQEKLKETKNKYRNNKNTKKIMEITGLDKDKAGKAYATMVSCGIGNITNIELFAKNKEYADSYYVEVYGIPAKIMVYIDENGNIPEMYYNMQDVIVDNKRVATIQNYILTQDEWIDLRTQAQVYIEKFLNAPNTAKYKNQNYSIDNKQIITVTGTVEAKNLFGVPLDNSFELLYKKENSGFSLIKATIAGEVVYNSGK